jgi:hypothetical protein
MNNFRIYSVQQTEYLLGGPIKNQDEWDEWDM